jgi:opacity protein-like surface antigen
MKKLLVLSVLAVALIAAPAMAKEGVYVGAGLVYDNIVGSDVNNYDAGGGGNIKVGYNFGSIALEGDWFKSSHSGKPGFTDADLSSFSVNLRAFLSQPNDPNQFYVLGGIGSFKLEFKQATVSGVEEFTGYGVNLGGGLEHYFNQNVALNLGLIYRIITYDKAKDAFGTFSISDQTGDTFSVLAGLNFYF